MTPDLCHSSNVGDNCTTARDLIAMLRAEGVASATFHPDGNIASVVLLPASHPHNLVEAENAREETPEEQKARAAAHDALLFASA